jgi:hypothetical protein
MPYTLTIRQGPKVTRERYAELEEAMGAVEQHGRELERGADARPVGGSLIRRIEPVQQVVARLELRGPGRLRADGRGRLRRAPAGAPLVSRVRLPRGAEPPYRVFVNGVPQRQGEDYEVVGDELHFAARLQKEKLGLGRWTAIFLGLFGSYGRNDQVDVQYQLGARTAHATGLEILPPEAD